MSANTYMLLFFVPFLMTALVMPRLISYLRALKAGQVIQKDGPQSHLSKSGTPTMGGLGIIVGLLAGAALIAFRLSTNDGPAFLAVVLLALFYGVVGFADDWLTVRPLRGRRGLSSKAKFGLQFLGAAAFVSWMSWSGNLNTSLGVGDFFWVDLGWAYAPLAVLFITGMANFINITDGLDGLAAGLTVILALCLFTLAIETSTGMLLFALAGACAAFLWFNFNPAKVFMGDTGSLAIGALIPAVAIVTKMEIPMMIAGMVFILDGLSSAIQWAVFKYTRIRTGTGKRVFKMSPIHHHFELSGWPEQLVVVRFWIVGGFFAVLTLLLTIGSQ